jgi:outer membrane immunogenic protein
MRRFRCALLAGVAVIGFASIASAADMPLKAPVYKAPPAAVVVSSWNNCYLGGNVGYSWGRGQTDKTDPTINTLFGTVPGTSFSDSNGLRGVIGGGQVGCNWQPVKNNWVFGVEADFQWSGENGSFQRNDPFAFGIGGILQATGTNVTDAESKISSFGTVRGRAGYLWGNVLLYGTGGLAYGQVNLSGQETVSGCVSNIFNGVCLPGGQFNQTTVLGGSKVKVGWTLGGGVEAPLANNWTWRLEYLYIDLGTLALSYPTSVTTSTKFTDNIVRLGLNYHFAGY